MHGLSCPVTVRGWRDGVAVDDPDLPNIKAHMDDPGVLVWMDLVNPTAQDMAIVAEHMHLAASAVEDVLAQHERPKVIRHDDRLFFMVYAVSRSADGLAYQRISGFVLPHALLTIRSGDGFDIGEVEQRWADSPSLLKHGAGALVYGLMDVVVDGQFEIIQAFDDEIERLEDELFDNHPGKAFLEGVYRVRKDLVQMRRVVLPMREVVNGLLRHRPDDAAELSRWYDDLYDHVLRASEWTESLRDMVTTVFETHLSLQDTRLNTVMKQLAAWAAIIAVPTAITGWFGQNVPYFGFSEPIGVWLSAGLILVVSTLLYVSFHRRDWL